MSEIVHVLSSCPRCEEKGKKKPSFPKLTAWTWMEGMDPVGYRYECRCGFKSSYCTTSKNAEKDWNEKTKEYREQRRRERNDRRA